MGWFSSTVSNIGSAMRSVASVAAEVGRKVASEAKKLACKAIDFMANKAEKYVGRVKKWWPHVKPILQKLQAPLKAAAAATASMPYVGPVVGGISVGLDALFALEKSPVLKKMEKAIVFVAARARDLEQHIKDGKFAYLTAEDYEAARNARISFRTVESEVAREQRAAFDLAAAINDFGIARNDLHAAIKAGPQDFEHYLRMRATQKLLKIEENRLRERGLAEGLAEDDCFVLRVAADLVKPQPELQADAAERLDRILREQHGKSLQSFIYEELIASWKKRAEALDAELESAKGTLAEKRTTLRRLQVAKSIQDELAPAEAQALHDLEASVPELEDGYDVLRTEKEDVERYADAAEGFLQMLEKTPEQLEQEDRTYLLREGAAVGAIILEAGEKDIGFAELDEAKQALITDFANIFQDEARARMESILEVTA